MPSLKEVRNRITSVKSTQQITKAMKMVAAAKLRRAQNAIQDMRPYAEKLDGILRNLSVALKDEDYNNVYAEERAPERVLVVVVSSDKGLCGAFNTNVFRTATRLIDEKYAKAKASGKVEILAVGKKAAEYFQRRDYKVISDFMGIQQGKEIPFARVREAAEFAMEGFVSGRFDRVEIVYNEFKNAATQILRTKQFLPVEAPEVEENATNDISYLFEPDMLEIVEDLIPKSLKINFYKAVLDSNASEHSARMTAMDKATDNAGELLKDLKLSYNRARQANITKEILEIVGGAEALAQS